MVVSGCEWWVMVAVVVVVSSFKNVAWCSCKPLSESSLVYYYIACDHQTEKYLRPFASLFAKGVIDKVTPVWANGM
jgi:hypothetical protein